MEQLVWYQGSCPGHGWDTAPAGFSLGLDPEVSIRDKISVPKGIWPHHGGVPLLQAQHPESGTTSSTRWHLCDPEGPWQGEKLTEDSQFLREGWFEVFPLHFLAQEGRAHHWQSLFPHSPTAKLSQSLYRLNFQKEEEKIKIRAIGAALGLKED